jgi:hypothetical protein
MKPTPPEVPVTATLPAPTATSWSPDQWEAWRHEVRRLARERDAVLLAHNYQAPEIQDVADHVGDSLALSRLAAASEASTIVFAGVHFMAETAKILAPEKTVLVPDAAAGCSLADTITADQLRAWKSEHPGAVVVSYVNTSAEVKAETDVCCTSSNAVEVVESIPADREVLFLPDQFLGAHVQRVTGRANMRIWMGECHVHAGISPTDLRQSVANAPDAELLVHRRDARPGPADDGEAGAGGHRDRHAAPAAPGQPGHVVRAGQLPRGLPLHEDVDAREVAPRAARGPRRGHRRSGDRRPGAGSGGSDGRHRHAVPGR